MARRVLLSVLGLLLLPLCWSLSVSLVHLVMAIQPDSDWPIPPAGLALAGGFVLWEVIFLTLTRPVRAYVLGHELTHALWGAMMGARVLSIKVSKESGSVSLSRSNMFITLAPYFFPFYTFLVLLAYYALSIFLDVTRWNLLWLGLVGFTWGFHLTFTITTLLQKQSDIRAYSHLFSYAVIYIMNVVGICLWVIMVAPVTLEQGILYIREDAAVVFSVVAGRAVETARDCWRSIRDTTP